MWRYSPLTLGDWLKGRGLTPGTSGYRPGPDDYERWANIYAKSPTASIVLDTTDDYASFYAVESDLAKLIPRQELVEAFYSMKLGFCTPGVPAQFLYVSKALWEQYHICNLVTALLPMGIQASLSKKGYIGCQYTGLDAYRTILDENFNLMDSDNPIVKCGEWYEAYLPVLGMVAALPPAIGSRLSATDLDKVHQVPGVGLAVDGTPLTSVGGLKGVCDSVFDLRRAI